MKSHIPFLATMGALLATVSLGIHGAHAYMGEDALRRPGHYQKKMMSELGLSAAQMKDIKDIFNKNRPQVKPLVQQLVKERRALRTLVQAENIDEPAISAQAAKVAAVETDMALQRARVAHEMRAVLTPEQVEKYKALQKQRDSKLDGYLSGIAKRVEEE